MVKVFGYLPVALYGVPYHSNTSHATATVSTYIACKALIVYTETESYQRGKPSVSGCTRSAIVSEITVSLFIIIPGSNDDSLPAHTVSLKFSVTTCHFSVMKVKLFLKSISHSPSTNSLRVTVLVPRGIGCVRFNVLGLTTLQYTESTSAIASSSIEA